MVSNGNIEKAEIDGAELRCHCGNLMARLVSGGIELKCRRCRRLVVLPLEVDDGS